MAQIGMLKYLGEQGVRPDVISGASGGAIVGALYAAGYSPDDILSFFTDNQMFKFDHLSFNKLGLINSERLRRNFRYWIKEDDFSSLEIPLFVSTTDLNTGKAEVFNSGSLVSSLLASSAYPGVMTPVSIGGRLFADGGITNNYPTDVIHEKCRWNLGMYLGPVKYKGIPSFKDAFDVLERVFEIYSSAHLLKSMKLADISLSPRGIDKWGAFNVDNDSLYRLYDMGYEVTRDYFNNEEGEKWLKKFNDSFDLKGVISSFIG